MRCARLLFFLITMYERRSISECQVRHQTVTIGACFDLTGLV